MRSWAKYNFLSVGFVCFLAIFFSVAEFARASCNTEYDNQGPYYTLSCFADPDCENHIEDSVCEEEDCSNCLHQQTGYSQFCVESYDCSVIEGCYPTHCT